MSGTIWTSRTSAADNLWCGVTYGNGLFVAVSETGTLNKVMTSPDGVIWSSITTNNNNWQRVTYGNGLFVAVSTSGTGDRVMTSPDGINWTLRTSAADNAWRSVTYGNGLFVAVSSSGTGNRVMTSPDGINWTLRTSAVDNEWWDVTYGGGLFVAVSISGSANRAMTSPDGITWTSRTTPDVFYRCVTYGNGLFVAVASAGSGSRVMTSPNGINWTPRSAAAADAWYGVTYGDGLFVAVGYPDTGNGVMTSTDGINWTARTAAAVNLWRSVTYSEYIFVAVSGTGSGNRVMTSGQLICVIGSTKILMKDGTLKEIKDIKRGDEIKEDKLTNKSNIVSRILSNKISNKYLIKIPKKLLGNDEDIYITEPHPVWINNDQNRILSKNIKDVERIYVESEIVYSIQYDTEGTFYANGLKVDSLSPYHKYYPLPKELFIDDSKYIKGIKIFNEDDEIRNKPKIINNMLLPDNCLK